MDVADPNHKTKRKSVPVQVGMAIINQEGLFKTGSQKAGTMARSALSARNRVKYPRVCFCFLCSNVHPNSVCGANADVSIRR